MNFAFTDDQSSIRDLARGILEKECSHERLKQLAARGEWCDRALWSTLAEAGLLGLAVPADLGGMGFGIEEICVLLQEVGRATAPVPVLAALALGGLPIARFGSAGQRKQWLVPLADGSTILTAALVDAGSTDPARPATRARRQGAGWVLEGEKRQVPALDVAARVLVPAATDDGVGLFLVDPRSAGVAVTHATTSTGQPLSVLSLAGVQVGDEDVLADTRGSGRASADAARWLHEHALVAICALQVGVSERAIEITSGYVRDRIQFGVPIGSFQAVQHRAADCYVDLEAMRWVTWRAAWKLARDLDVGRDAAVAKFWAAEAGARIAAAAQHLHGGIGVDVDYPIHRYFLWSKALELELGAAAPQLARLGAALARSAPEDLA